MPHPVLPQPPAVRQSENPGWGAAWMAAMERGDFPAAWAVSDRVLQARDPATRDDPAQPPHERWVWDGRGFAGRRTLVRCYHGLGDTLQFSRFLPALRRRASHVTLEVQPALLPLLDGWADRVAPIVPGQPLPDAERTVEIMELCHALRIAPDTRAYLSAPGPGPEGPIQAGLCWHVSSGFRPERSVPANQLRPLLAVPGVGWHGLQPDPAGLPGLCPAPAAIADTARLIRRLDLVVTVDTMVAHLAGAMGVPVWLLLDAGCDWRWRAGGTGSVWYGGVRKYRQAAAGSWAAPLAALAADLTAEVRAGTLAVRSGS